MSDKELLFAQVASMGVPEEKIRAALAANCTSVDAVLEWCFLHGDSATAVDDAVTDSQMTPSQPVGHAPSPANQVVYKDECVLSFEGPTSADGLFIHTRTFIGMSGPNFVEHCAPGESWVRLQRKEVRIDLDAAAADEPTKMAIGVTGGFVTAASRIERTDTYHVVTVHSDAELGGAALQRHLPPAEFLAKFCRVREMSDASLPSDVASAARVIELAAGNEFVAEQEQWEEDIVASRFAHDLPQPQAPPVPAVGAKCVECDLTTNLWVNLSDGHIGCGRQQWGEGITGRSHALAHYEAMRAINHDYPLVVKLGTISGSGGRVSGDVYSYHPSENDTVLDPLLAQHLAHVGISVVNATKSEKTTTELSVALNKDHTFRVITEGGKNLQPAGGPGLVGLGNLGNTCYMAAVLQALFHTQPFMDRFVLPPLAPPVTTRAQAGMVALVDDVEVQTRRLAIGLLGPPLDCMRILDSSSNSKGAGQEKGTQPTYSIKPTLFRALVAAAHRPFASRQQQDAQEFWLVFAGMLDKHDRSARFDTLSNPVDNFRFKLRTRTRPADGGAVRSSTTSELTLLVPIVHDAMTNKAEMEAWKALSAAEQEQKKTAFDDALAAGTVEIAADMSNAVPPLPRVPFEACVSAAFAQRTTDMGATQEVSMATFPDYLVVTVSRFIVDERTWTAVKDDAVVVVPETLSLASHRSPPVEPGEELSEAPVAASAGGSNVNVSDDDVATLSMILDVSKEIALRALKETGANMDRAAEWVMSRLDDPAALLATGEGTGAGAAGGTSAQGGGGASLPDGPGDYELRAIVSHAGANVHSGHYVAHVKVNGVWHCFNDEEVAVSKNPPLGRGYLYFFKRKVAEDV